MKCEHNYRIDGTEIVYDEDIDMTLEVYTWHCTKCGAKMSNSLINNTPLRVIRKGK